MATFFSDYFDVSEDVMTDFGVFNVSLVNDLPLFIDPFLLFHSEKEEYKKLHAEMIQYVAFLRDHAGQAIANEDLLKAWYCFPEIKQNWLGFSVSGNSGSGLGMKFARALSTNLGRLFSDFGHEKITEGSHLEKVCLISSGVGRDNISDFTTNLIIDHLCRYTEQFAEAHLRKDPDICLVFSHSQTEPCIEINCLIVLHAPSGCGQTFVDRITCDLLWCLVQIRRHMISQKQLLCTM
nr:hypothetical protein [uncultured Cohaesibacter sp.]